jgi:hypothetical protein
MTLRIRVTKTIKDALGRKSAANGVTLPPSDEEHAKLADEVWAALDMAGYFSSGLASPPKV